MTLRRLTCAFLVAACSGEKASPAENGTGSLRGIVVDSAGGFVPFTEVALRSEGGSVQRGVTQSDGTFRFETTGSGPHTLELSGSDLGGARYEAEVSIPRGQEVDHTVTIGTPPNGSWKAHPSLLFSRLEHNVVVAGDAAWVIGGFDANSNAERRVERYENGSWQHVTDLPGSGVNHAASVVLRDTIYVLGGYVGATFVPTDSVWRYSIADGSWTPGVSLPDRRGAHMAVVLNGRIHVVGGARLNSPLTSHIAFDPATGTWEELAPMPTEREHLAGVVLNGRIYAIGGRALGTNTAVVEVWDPQTNEWTAAPPLLSARSGLTATASDLRIFVFGGEDLLTGGVIERPEAFSTASGWIQLRPMPTPRHGFGAVVLHRQILTIGGGPAAGFSDSRVVEQLIVR